MSNNKPIVMIAAVVAIAVIGFLIAGQQEKVAVQKDVKLGITTASPIKNVRRFLVVIT